MVFTTLSKKGQLVIPGKIRRQQGLKQGDRFLVKCEDEKIILEPLERHPILRLRGAFKGKTSLTQALLRERHLERTREDGPDLA